MSVTTKPAPGTNVVPLPTAVPPSPYWPMPSVTPGCCPPGGMSNLMQCYCDVQSATAFICAVMVDCINTNPAVAEAMIAAIQKSGSNLPLLGVTNGVEAQPGQVGEFIAFTQQTPFTTAANQSITLTMGVLQPGDWDVWAWVQYTAPVISGEFLLVAPLPAGFSGNLFSFVFTGSADDSAWTNIVSTTEQANISVPTLIALTVNTNQIGAGTTTGTIGVQFRARRRR